MGTRPLSEATRRTFENYGDIFVVDSIQEAVDAVNQIAPEHAMRGYSVINYPESALKTNADYIIQLAESEGMKAHALAVKVRK